MKVNQIYSTLNTIMEQYWGEEGITVNDLTGLIAMGNTVLASDDNTDTFLNALVDRIGKTTIRTLDLELDYPNLFMDSFEFGAVLQKITVKPFEAIENNSWNIGEDEFTPSFAEIHKPEIVCTYFTDMTTWKYQVTIPHYQVETAFTDATSMNNFLTAIITAMTDSLTMSINGMSRTAICNFIAEKIKAENGVINLLAMYNEAYPNDDTVDDYTSAMQSATFLRFAGKIIRNTIRYMSKPSVLYNVTEDVLRATPRDSMHVFLNTSFVSAYEVVYSSDVYHDEIINLNGYQEVEYWQGSGDEILDEESMTSINVIPSSDKKEGAGGTAEPVEATGVIGLICDRQAIAIGLNKMKAGAWTNTIDHYTNESRSCNIQWINDLSENGCVFLVAPTE